MPQYFDSCGNIASESQATIDGRLRPGFKSAMADGEYARFSISLIDSAAPVRASIADAVALIDKADDASIDAALKSQIALQAKNQNMDAAEYLMTLEFSKIEDMIAKVALDMVKSIVGQSMASQFVSDGHFDRIRDKVAIVYDANIHQDFDISRRLRDAPPNF